MEPEQLKEIKNLESIHEDLKTIFNNLKISVDNISTSLDKWSRAEEETTNIQMDDVNLYDAESVYKVLLSSIEAIKHLTYKNDQNVYRLNKII